MLPDVRNVRYSLSLTDQVAGRQEGKTPMKLILQNNLCAYEYIGESSRYMFHFRIYFLSLNHHMAHFSTIYILVLPAVWSAQPI